MKKCKSILSVFLSVLMILSCVSVGFVSFAADAWDGSTKDTSWYDETKTYFELGTGAALAGLAKLVNEGKSFEGCSFKLTADIDLGSKEWTPIGNDAEKSFKGTFNGDKHTVSNFKISSGTNYSGLFGIASRAVFINTAVSGASVTSVKNAGGLTGYAEYCEYTGCAVGGTIKATTERAGGLAGSALNCSFVDCENTAAVTSPDKAGGIAGYFNRSTASACSNSGEIKSGSNLGGIAGYVVANANTQAVFSACMNTGSVSGSSVTGGIAGYAQGADSNAKVIIKDCFNKSTALGGIVGTCASYVELSRCISTGTTTKGIVNVKSDTTSSSSSCFYSGANADSIGATKKTEAQLKSASTFSAYGVFVSAADLKNNPDNVWKIQDGDYPKLYWEAQKACTEHNFVKSNELSTPNTCGEEGMDVNICSECGAVEYVPTLPTGEHSYKLDEDASTPPTCSTAGTNVYACENCSAIYSEEAAATGLHDYEYKSSENCLKCANCSSTITTASGTCGESATWELDVSGGKNIFTVSGTGAMETYTTGSDWAIYKPYIKSVIISEGITSIGAYDFESCSALANLTLSSTVTEIGAHAFDTTALVTVTLPESVTKIGDYAFANASALSELTFMNQGTTTAGANIVSGSNNVFVHAYCTASFFATFKSSGVRMTSSGGHTAPAATCQADGRCTVCNAVVNEKIPHSFENGLWITDPNNAANHVRKCDNCYYTDPATSEAHAVGETGTAATCQALAECAKCGSEFGDFAEHDFDTENWITDGTNHWHKCKTSGCDMTADLTAHSGGTATCTATAVCEVCQTAYGSKDPNNHASYTTYIKEGTAIAETCGDAGYEGDIYCNGCKEKVKDGEAIAPTGNHTGGTATCLVKAQCTDCGQYYGELAGHTGGTATCTEKAICEVCHNEYGEEPAGHSYSQQTSETQHWSECATCHNKINVENHKGGKATCTEQATCSVCSQKYGTALSHSYSTKYDGDKHWEECTRCGDIQNEQNHSGGTATCCDYAICESCGQPYGEYAPSNHASYATYIKAGTPKAATCAVKGYEGDIYCSGCNTKLRDGNEIAATGAHTGGAATCVKKAECVVCGQEYGEFAAHDYDKENWTTDANRHYHKCKNCDAYTDSSAHTGGTATCKAAPVCEVCSASYASKNMNNHIGETKLVGKKDASCTEKGYTGDTICDTCKNVIQYGEEVNMTAHEGGVANCRDQAVCENCGNPYGEKAADVHIGSTHIDTATVKEATCAQAGYTGDVICDGCGKKLADGQTRDKLAHSGGTATCTDKAVCDTCHQPYGNVDPSNHTGEIVTTGVKEATCTAEGYTGNQAYSCCGKPVSYGHATLPTSHNLSTVSGSEGCWSWTSSVCSKCDFASSTVTLQVLYPSGEPFVSSGMKLDGKAISTDGNGMVTLTDLSVGTHTLKADSGLYTAVITVGTDGKPTVSINSSNPPEPPADDDEGGGRKRWSFWEWLVSLYWVIRHFVENTIASFK